MTHTGSVIPDRSDAENLTSPRFRPFSNPATGERIEFTAAAEEGSSEIEGVVELRPALRSREMHEAFGGLATEGKTTRRSAPREPRPRRRGVMRQRSSSSKQI